MYNFIDWNQAVSPAHVKHKLEEAEEELRRIYVNPLTNFYMGLKHQLEQLSEQLNEGYDLMDLRDETGKTDRTMNILMKAEPLTRMIESIGSKNFPASFKTEGDVLPGNDSYVAERDKKIKMNKNIDKNPE